MPSLFGMTPARSATLLHIALLILMIPPFLADMTLPLGMSVWVLYLLPITLSYLTSRAIIPPLLAVMRPPCVYIVWPHTTASSPARSSSRYTPPACGGSV